MSDKNARGQRMYSRDDEGREARKKRDIVCAVDTHMVLGPRCTDDRMKHKSLQSAGSDKRPVTRYKYDIVEEMET